MPTEPRELKPYDINSPCPACGVTGAKSKYLRSVRYRGRRDAIDLIRRSCANCGLKWYELPLG